MKRLALVTAIGLALSAATAQATSRAPLGGDAYRGVVQTLSTLVSKGTTPASTRVERCVWTDPTHGRCYLTVRGTAGTCHVTAHVRWTPAASAVWASRVDCGKAS